METDLVAMTGNDDPVVGAFRQARSGDETVVMTADKRRELVVVAVLPVTPADAGNAPFWPLWSSGRVSGRGGGQPAENGAFCGASGGNPGGVFARKKVSPPP